MDIVVTKDFSVEKIGQNIVRLTDGNSAAISINTRNIIWFSYPIFIKKQDEEKIGDLHFHEIPEHWLIEMCGGSEHIILRFQEEEMAKGFYGSVMYQMMEVNN